MQPQIEKGRHRFKSSIYYACHKNLVKASRSGFRWSIFNSSHCTRNVYHIFSCSSLIWVLYFISIFLDYCLGFEPTLQLKSWNLRAPQNETHMTASILNTAPMQCSRSKSSMPFKRYLALQNIPLSKEPFKMQPQIEKGRHCFKSSI